MANKQLVIEIISDARKFTSGLTEAISTIGKATKKAEGFEKYTEQLNEMKETLSQVSQNISQFEKTTQSGGEVSQTQLDSLATKIESINKRFDSFRHTFGDMQEKLNGLSTRTLQAQLDRANASLDAFNQKYSSLQQTLSVSLGVNKDISQISNIGEMKAAYEDALRIFKSFSKEMQEDKNGNYSKVYIDAASAVYKYADALISLNNIYHKKNKENYFSEDDFDKIEDTAFIAEDIIGDKLKQSIQSKVQLGLKNINIKSFFEEVAGQIDNQTLTGALKNGGVIIPVKIDPKAFSSLESEIKKDISALQSRANANPIKIHYETNTEDLSKNIEKYFNELNTKLKNQVAELNTLMKGLVDDTGLKKTEQDFSSIAKLIPEMLRKVAEYSEQLKTITTDTKISFENVNNFVKEENFINYANAIKQTAESFKLLTSSLDDVSSKLSGNGLEGQFDLLKKKFSELSIDSILNKETTKETEAAKKAKIKEIKELFALYSTYQSRGGIRPFSDLISGEVDANKKAYLQLAYNDYAKNKNKKGTGTEPTPFDAKQLKDILQILKEIKETIKSISETKIDTSELAEAISKIQGNNNEPIFTPQNVAQIWQVLIQYANNYSESLSKVIEKLEIISEKDFEPLKLDSEEFKKTYNQIESITQLLEKGFGISLNPENQLKDNIQGITEANQTATESNQKLAESMQEVAQAAQEEKEAVIDPAVKDYLIKWIEMVKGTKAYSGMEERAVFLKGGTPASDVGQGKLSYKNGFVQGQTSIRQYKDGGADTLLHSHQYSKDVDNLRFSFADIKQGMSDLAGGVQDGIRKLILSCGNEILSLDFGNVSKETASEVQENIRQIYTAAWTIFGGQVFSDGTASERGMTDELRNKASAFINTMLRKMLEEMGGSLTSAKLVDGKMIDTTVSRLNQTITPQQQNLFEQIKKIYGLSENEYEGYRGDILKKLQKDNGIETNLTGLAGLSKTELEEIDKLLLQIFNHKQQLEKTKTGTRVESTLKEKIAEAEKRISEITKKTFPPEKTPAQQKPDVGIKENQVQQQTQQTQQAIQQTNNEIENTDQSIITLVSDIKNALNGLSSDLNILAEIIVSLNNSTEQVDYSSRISNIRGGITTLNNSIKELVDLVRQLDFDKINNIKISTEPFDKIIESLKEIIDLTERISGVPSKSSLDSQFKDIQKIYSSLVNDKGNFIVTKNKDAVQNLFSQYSKYLKFGGTKALTDLDDSKSNANKLSKYYNKYLDNISQQNESGVSTTSSIKNEAQSFIDIRDAANGATASKESFIKANKKLETQTDKTSKSLEQEKTQFETFINDVKTLVTTDIESNNVVNFNTQILDSAKQTNETLKEELQYLQKLNEIQKTNPIKQNNISVVSHNDSSKKQDSKKRISSFEKPNSEFNYEDLGLSYDPYLTAFQEFLLIAAEEAEKVKQQIISVAEFDNRLSEALAALYGQIPDLDDISASTGYGKNFNVTGATVSFRDKATNDIYRKTFSLKKDKETGNFYIDQTTSILNDAEKYGKDNEKQAQKVLEWQTKLNAWLQSFSNKTSGTLDSTKDFQSLKNFNFTSEKDWVNIKTIQQRLEGLYNEIVSNSRRGTSSLSPVPNMMFGQESRLTKMQKVNSIYNKMALNWNGGNGAEDTENELRELSSLYDNLQIEIKKFNEDGSNIDSVAQAYGAFNEQLNKVNEQLNRMKIVNTEISGNKINALNNWFKDMPDPSSAEGKIEKYGQVYGQFVEAQQRLNELTTNLNRGTTEEDAQEYENRKEKIHEIVLELEEFKKILSSDSMNVNNQMGQVIKQNIPETKNIEELRRIINEYADARGKIIDSSETGTTIDKEGNEFVTFTRKIQDTKGAIAEFEFTYNKAMGTVAVATKKIQEPESAFKALADELTTKWRGLFTTLASFTGFYRLWGYFKQGINTIREFDTALTEMQKVSDETILTLQQYQSTTFDTADAIGATALQIQNSTADFMRLGESLKEAAESAKTANILMNVSEFQSIDEATKSLIAMSAAYDDLSKMNIIDKLNEVGNNYAISTSEAATALQNSASALKTAGNDMDESLALITAGNAVVQDANKVGTGMRTIALRLTGTKSAKESLEELGEETDSMLTTQSKLRDTIKEATAVASNNFKGFDILDNNGNYKSTYEIMLGIADVYDEILETDKQFGRNNANLLLESVAGKTRANIAASIFQNPQLLRDAYKSSQEAENSAIEENEKYMDSINGHIAQLQNAYQQMWANSMNRETVNFFIDLGKAIVQVADNVGLLGTAFTAIVGVRSIVGYQNGRGFAYELVQSSKEAIKALAKQENAIGSLASTGISAGKAIGGSFSAAIPMIMGVGTAIGVIGILIHAFVKHQEQVQKELVNSARTTGEEWQSQKQTLSDYASQYEELKTKLDSGNLSEQEALETKQQIYDIQKQITEQYGENANKINLINGELREQLDIINSISQAEANRIWDSEEYQKGFNIAYDEIMNPEGFKIYADSVTEDVEEVLKKNLGRGMEEVIGAGGESSYFSPLGDAYERRESILKSIDEIEKLQKSVSEEESQKYYDGILKEMRTYRDVLDKTIKENESIVFSGLEIKLGANNYQGYDAYKNYQSSISDLESAYISGNTKQINKAREAFEEATKAKDEFLRLPENNEYSMLFDQIDTSVVDTKNKTEDATKAIKKSLQVGKEIENNLSRFDEYRQQKEVANNYKKYLEGAHLDKIGNIDNTNRPLIFWDEKEVEKQKDALESWGESVEDVIGSYSTVFGGSAEFDGVEIAYTPIINDGTGKGKLLTKETLNNYISALIDSAGEGWTDEDLLKLDAQGLIIDGQKISNVIAQIGDAAGDTVSGIGLTAQQVGELMHDWQSGSLGYIESYQDEWKEAIKQGKSFEEYMADQEKDLKDVTKATGKYTKEDKQLYQALKRVIDLDIDKVDAQQAFDESANGSQIYRIALEDLMNVLGYTMDDSALMIDMLVANGIIYGDVSDATLSASDAYNQFSQEVATAIENVSKLNAVLTESVSGAGITTQNIDAFKEMFGDDYVYALERSANGYHINAEKLQTLTDKQKALMNANFQNTLDAQYDALKRCNDEIALMSSQGQDTSGLLSNREGILKRIQDTKDLMMAYQASTSAYQTWVNAQSNGNEYDMYDKIAAGYDTIKDLIDRGWSGDDTVRSFLDLIYGDSFDAMTASGEECAEMFDNLDKKIEGTSFSINDFFQMDESGKLTSNGIFNFFDAVKEKQKELKKEWLTLDENGNITDFNFGIGGDREVAEALGMDVELVQSILRAAVSAGFELNLDQPIWAMNDLRDKAVSAQEELGGFNNIDFSKFNEEFLKSDEAYETLSGHVSDVYDYIQEIENSDELAPDVKTDMIENAQDMLAYLVALEREAADKSDIDLKIKIAEDATSSIKQLIDDAEELPEELSKYDWDSITDAKGLEKAKDYIEGLKGSGAIDTSTAETFLSILYEAIDQLNIIDNYEANPEFKGNTVEAFNNVENARKELEQYITTAQQLEEKHNITFNFAEDGKVNQLLSIIYREGTPEILASLDIDSDKTPEEIIEMLESGERDVDVLLKPDSSELEEKIEKANQEKVVTHKVNSVANDVVNKTTNIVEEQTNQTVNTFMDTSSYDEGANHVKETNEELVNGDTNVEVGMDKKEFERGSNETENEVSHLDKLGAFPSVVLSGVSQVVSGSETIKSSIDSIKGKTISVTANFFSNGLSALQDGIQSAINKARELMNTKIHLANGTAHFQGTAFSRGSIVSSSAYAGGKWGLPNDQTALTGELGTEIVVRDGNWFMVGDNGAEFVNLKKGDIVFNHKQSEELLENGYVTSNKGRGHLVGFANGTAYSSGSMSGATRARVSTSSKKSSSSKSSGGSGGSSGGSGGGGGNNSSSNDAKETKNTLDEVEILIARIERNISNLDKTISNTYTTWTNRNKAIVSNLKNVNTEIKDQEKAFTTYVNKAKSVGLSSAWKAKIRDGAFRIEDVKDSDLWDKINEYKQWWEKALACKDAIIDLKQKEGELYKQRFDNEQTYYEEVIANTQHAIDLVEAFNDQLSEAGRLGSVLNIQQQIALERKRLTQLTDEYNSLIKQRDSAVSSGKITKGSETWYEMQQSINEVSESIAEANTNLITFANNIRDISFDRWDKVHDAIGGVVNELEFFYDLLNPDEMFDEQGSITDQGITGFALLAQEYDTYFREVQRYQDEINETNRLMAEAEYDQNLVDKLKELKEGQQDAAANAKKMKESMVDLTEDGIKKQIDYVKKLIEDYEDLLETQKDQTEYAKKVADQQKEINKLEKQYRAIQNDNSEEGATKRQQLRDQINEKRQELQETQEDRRLSETKDMLGDFEEKFEEFLENKLKNIEGIVREAINTTNENRDVIKDTINNVAKSYGYTPSDTLKAAINNMSNNLVSYFNGDFENPHVASIAEGVDAIVKYFLSAQNDSEQVAKNRIMADKIKQSGTHIQTYTDDNGNTKTGFFRDDGSLFENYTGWADKDGKTYRFNNGELMKGSQWVTVGGKKYHLDSSGARATGFRSLNGKMYYFDKSGVMQTGLTNIDGKQFYFDKEGVQQTGLQTVGGARYYFNKDGTKATSAWRNINGDLYYFDDKGKAITGWMKDSKGNWRFFSPKTNKLVKAHWIHNNNITDKPVKGDYYVNNQGIRVVDGKRKTTKGYMTFDANGKWKGYKTGTKGVSRDDLYWTNEGKKPEAIIRKSDGAILTPLSKGDSVIPNNAMKNMYQALTDPAKYLKQYTTPDIKVVQSNNNNSNSQPPIVNMQFIANGVQDANKFVNDLMNNKKLEKWIQEVTLGQANGNNNYKKYSYTIR